MIGIIIEGVEIRAEIMEQTEDFDRRAKAAQHCCIEKAHAQARKTAQGHFEWETNAKDCPDLDVDAMQECYETFYDVLQHDYLLDCEGIRASNINNAVMDFRDCLKKACGSDVTGEFE